MSLYFCETYSTLPISRKSFEDWLKSEGLNDEIE